MLVCMLAMYIDAGTTDIPMLTAHGSPRRCRPGCSSASCVCCGEGADVACPYLASRRACRGATAGSMILAGVLLKMGGYGFIRFSLPMFPLASEFFAPLIFALSIVAVIYTSLVALAQSDMKS